MLQELLQTPEWGQVQNLWLNLQCAEVNAPFTDRDFLWVWTDRQLNVLQRLVLRKQLTPAIQHEIRLLFQCRFEQVLTRFYPPTPQPYGPQHLVPRGPFTRYQALGDLEQAFRRCQHQLQLPQVPQALRDHVLHDLNFEVIERYIRYQPAEVKALCWQPALEQVVWLSWRETQEDVFSDIEAAGNDIHQRRETALRALKSSPLVSVQCSAVRVLANTEQVEQIAEDYFLPLLQSEQTPETVGLEILTFLPPQERWEWDVLQWLRQKQSNSLRQRAVKYWMCLKHPRHRDFLYQLLQTHAEQWPTSLIYLCWEALLHTSPASTPCEELTDAFPALMPLFQRAVAEHDSHELSRILALFTLLRDPRTLSLMLGALNGTFRQDSVLEQMGGGFQGERLEEANLLKSTLEALGARLYFDSVEEKWRMH